MLSGSACCGYIYTTLLHAYFRHVDLISAVMLRVSLILKTHDISSQLWHTPDCIYRVSPVDFDPLRYDTAFLAILDSISW